MEMLKQVTIDEVFFFRKLFVSIQCKRETVFRILSCRVIAKWEHAPNKLPCLFHKKSFPSEVLPLTAFFKFSLFPIPLSKPVYCSLPSPLHCLWTSHTVVRSEHRDFADGASGACFLHKVLLGTKPWRAKNYLVYVWVTGLGPHAPGHLLWASHTGFLVQNELPPYAAGRC